MGLLLENHCRLRLTPIFVCITLSLESTCFAAALIVLGVLVARGQRRDTNQINQLSNSFHQL